MNNHAETVESSAKIIQSNENRAGKVSGLVTGQIITLYILTIYIIKLYNISDEMESIRKYGTACLSGFDNIHGLLNERQAINRNR